MAIYEFLLECKKIAVKNGYYAEVRRLDAVIACLSVEEAGKEIKK